MLKKYKLGKLMTAEGEAKATAKAIDLNLARQERIAKSPTVSLAAQSDGSAGNSSLANAVHPNFQVIINAEHGTADDYSVKIQNDLNALARRRGGIPISHRTR